MASFIGLVRPFDLEGRALSGLFLEHHPRLTLQSLETIGADALARFDVSHVWVVHRAGSVWPGESIVFAAVASSHRRAAFEAADYLMDRLKSDAFFWKCEDHSAGSIWIEPTLALAGWR